MCLEACRGTGGGWLVVGPNELAKAMTRPEGARTDLGSARGEGRGPFLEMMSSKL